MRGMVRCDLLCGFIAFCGKGGVAFIAFWEKKGRKDDRITWQILDFA